jgi:hypothetical protein
MMTRISILVIWAVLAAPAAAQNLLTNGDFETGNLSGWNPWSAPWSFLVSRTANNTEPGRLGSYCLMLSASTGSFGVYQEVAVQPGRTYKVDAYWRGVSTSAQTWYEILVLDGPYTYDAVETAPQTNRMYTYDGTALPPPMPSFGWIWAHDQNDTPVDNYWNDRDGKRVATGTTMTVVLKAGGFSSMSAFYDDVSLVVVLTADFDGDADVDLADFGVFQRCFNGPNRPPASADCTNADFDQDNDVDLGDFGKFQACFNGPNRPPNTGCL